MSAAEELARAGGAPRSEVDGRHLAPMPCDRDASSGQVLTRPEYLYEIKLDGVRIVADKRGEQVHLTYRKIRDATSTYPEVADALRTLAEQRVVLDGELVAFDPEGRPSFQLLGRRIQGRSRDMRSLVASLPVVYVVFDILAVGAYDLRSLPLSARKGILARVLEGGDARLKLHPVFDDGSELFRLCRLNGLEGVIAKRRTSLYRAGEQGREPPRTDDWVKVKCELECDLVVIGWTEGEGRRSALGALDLGAYEDGKLVVAGSAGSGLDQATIDLLLDRLRPLEVKAPVAVGNYLPKRNRHHARPVVVVSIRYMGITDDGLLRHPVFRGLRDDVLPEECVLDPMASQDQDALAVSAERFAIRVSPRARHGKGSAERAVAVVSERLASSGLRAFARPAAGGAIDLVVLLAPAPLDAVHALALLVLRLAEADLRRQALACKVEIPRRLLASFSPSPEEKACAAELAAAVSAIERTFR